MSAHILRWPGIGRSHRTRGIDEGAGNGARHLAMLPVVVCLLAASGSVCGMTFNETQKLTASDGAAGDNFGWSVAISGDLAVIGAIEEDDGGSESGAAYVFDVTTGSQLFKLTASDATAGDRFGKSVAVSGNTAIIGARTDDRGKDSGSAYVFVTITGDANGDGVVDAGDLGVLGASWGTSNTFADLNLDGIANVADLGIIGRHWTDVGGSSSFDGGAMVPAPNAGVAGLALIVGIGMTRRMRIIQSGAAHVAQSH